MRNLLKLCFDCKKSALQHPDEAPIAKKARTPTFCSVCGVTGHNKATCKSSIKNEVVTEKIVNPKSKRPRKSNKDDNIYDYEE